MKRKIVKRERRMVQRMLVPVITMRELERIEAVSDKMERLQEELQELAENVNASLSVLRGENHPEGWSEIVVVDEHGHEVPR